MKKISSILVILLCVVLLLSACDKKEQPNQTTAGNGEKVLDVYYLASDPAATFIVKGYLSKDPNVKLNAVAFQSVEEMDLRISTESSSGKGADVVLFSSVTTLDTAKMAVNNAFLDLAPYLFADETFNAANYYPVLNAGKVGEKQLTFPLTKEQLAYCKTGTKLKAEVVLGSEKTTLDILVGQLYYDAARQGYRCIVTTDAAINMMEGQPVSARLSAVSDEYKTIVPNSAIVESENGNASFYVLREKRTTLGTQYYAVLQSSYILEQNGSFTALSAPITEPVISFWSKPLSNNAIVRIEP